MSAFSDRRATRTEWRPGGRERRGREMKYGGNRRHDFFLTFHPAQVSLYFGHTGGAAHTSDPHHSLLAAWASLNDADLPSSGRGLPEVHLR